MNSVVTFEKHDDVGLIIVDNPPVNALSQAVRAGLLEATTELNNDNNIKAIVLHCAARCVNDKFWSGNRSTGRRDRYL